MVEALRLKESSDFSSDSLSNGYQTKLIPMAITNGTEKESTNIPMQKDSTAPTQAVKVAVHVRPLIGSEKLQGCKDCVTIVPGEPQVQIGNFGFTFDHVYGSTATPSSMIFEECIAPLVEGMFHGYNATVLAYGQTGSGKTYTMGTAYGVGDEMNGVIPQVMDLIFKKMETSAGKVDYQVRVSFIEILNEEVHDLLDSTSSISSRPDLYAGFCTRPITPKSMIQIRETMNGEITLSGVSECEVNSLQEMAALLEQGSLSRATASTNMNSQSSRSHAILTITLRQRRFELRGDNSSFLHNFHDCLCAKVHLVDLAGSERVKRTGADGVRFKEGVHINKGLLALGNVISALGDEKKRKEGGHVPYRDSKLTRLLQDSLGGNSRTVMIACISPADSNAEETLNTLKYANRARNIQNKPIVNRDPMAAEVQHLREQLELLQAELLCVHASNGSLEDTNMLKQKILWLEANNGELRQELQRAHDGLQFCAQRVLNALIERDNLRHKLELLRNGKSWEDIDGIDGYQTNYLDDSLDLLCACTNKIENVESNMDVLDDTKSEAMSESFTGYTSGSDVCTGDYMELQEAHGRDSNEIICTIPEEEVKDAARELEHARLQVSLDNELYELNEKLKRKEAEMKNIFTPDNMILKQQFEKKLLELEEEKKILQIERDELLLEIKNLACVSDVKNQKMQDACNQKLKDLESQLADLKHKQDNQTQLMKQRLRGDDAAKSLQEEIQRMKAQKVQLQQKIKQEAEQFRCWKASREKELLQLRKEGRKTEHEMLKLQALNQRQKMVLQRKTEEAALATRRLKDLLEARKSFAKENTNAGSNVGNNGSIKQGHTNHKALIQSIEQDLELAIHIHEVRKNYEKQSLLRARIARELGKLNKADNIQNTLADSGHDSERASVDFPPVSSPQFISARTELLRNMLETSSNTLISMASQLSEAEERERASTGRGRWQQLRTMGEAKGVLHYLFTVAIDARCQVWDKNLENRNLKENIERLTKALQLNEVHRIELYQHKYRLGQGTTEMHKPSGFNEISLSLSHVDDGVNSVEVNRKCDDSTGQSQYCFRKVVHRRSRKTHNPSMGRLVRWRRSHERWFLQFRWRWQKPWRLSELIRHGDEILTRARLSRSATSMKLINS